MVDEGCPQLAHHVRPWGFLISRGDFGIRSSFLSAHRLPALDQGSVRLQVVVEAQKNQRKKALDEVVTMRHRAHPCLLTGQRYYVSK